jgi:hypothetical protein
VGRARVEKLDGARRPTADRWRFLWRRAAAEGEVMAFENTSLLVRKWREEMGERREYLMRCFMNGLNETLYHQTIGEIRGIDHAMNTLDEIEKGN